MLHIVFFSSCKKKEDNVITELPQTFGKLSAILNEEKLINGSDTLLIVNEIGLAQFFTTQMF